MKVLNYNNEKYVLRRTIKESSLIKDYSAGELKTYYAVDTVLKRDGLVYLCNKIEDAEIV